MPSSFRLRQTFERRRFPAGCFLATLAGFFALWSVAIVTSTDLTLVLARRPPSAARERTTLSDSANDLTSSCYLRSSTRPTAIDVPESRWTMLLSHRELGTSGRGNEGNSISNSSGGYARAGLLARAFLLLDLSCGSPSAATCGCHVCRYYGKCRQNHHHAIDGGRAISNRQSSVIA